MLVILPSCLITGFTTNVTQLPFPSGGSEFTQDFSGVSGAQSFRFLCSILLIIVCPYVLFLFGHCIVGSSSI